MALDPKFRAFLDMPGMQLGRPPPEVTPPLMREGVKALASPLPPPPVQEVRELAVPGAAGPLPVRLYFPSAERPAPVTLFIHGGGFVLCDLDSHDQLCRSLARVSGCAVASVQYRLAPECKFPGPAEDCYAVLKHLAANGASVGIDSTRMAICGDSSGGNLAIAVTLLARDRGGPPLRHQALIYPVTDAACDSASMREFATGYMLSREIMQWFWECYLPTPADGADPLASPLRATSVAGLPPATVATAEFDILREEGESYADRLRSAGVAVSARRYLGMIHGFATMPHVTEVAERAIADVALDLRAALRGPAAEVADVIGIAKRLYAAALSADWTTVESLVSPDLRITEASALPFSGTYVGLDGLKGLFEKVGGMLAMRDVRFHEMCAAGDTVAVPIDIVVDDHGRMASIPVVEMLRVRDGKVVELTPYYFDAAQVNALVARRD